MKKSIHRKVRMLRISDGFLPLAFILTSALGKSTVSERVFLNTLFPALFALATARGVRIAFSEQPSMRKVAGSVKLALALQFIGALAFLTVDLIRNQGRFIHSNLIYICAGMMLNIEHVFYEYLFATGEDGSATRVRAITAAVTAAGIMMTAPASGDGLLPYGLEWLLGGAILAALVAALIGRSVGGRLKGHVNNRVLKCAPLSMIQSAVYPASWLLALTLFRSTMLQSLTAVPFFAGLAVYELARTPFRRSAGESGRFNLSMIVIALLGAIMIALGYVPIAQALISGFIGKWTHELAPTGVMLIVSSLCAFGMYGGVGRREG